MLTVSVLLALEQLLPIPGVSYPPSRSYRMLTHRPGFVVVGGSFITNVRLSHGSLHLSLTRCGSLQVLRSKSMAA